MPYLKIQTNVELIPTSRADTMKRISAHIAELLGKPERYVMMALQDGTSMLFDGSDDPVAFLELKSLGLPEERSAEFSEGLCALIASEFEIATDRIYIEFASPERHMFGWNSATF
ncbi:hypothetical protein BOW53_03935 [Solemya pervernicosa gill symbiont]|uniref:L-dopachrome isomerase n=2 Tax=Gammaproteobacteria incertae sedis TaxID=118884 RepID=A0A1T2L8Z3_9GAMM|nr:phenylpyruvate tautomerase MIF-related protein [Candidatus Reidiella endopervernicosa]OOZ41406.1 hypothetical protein BOW53_03935 [Solemya pervernicosa gill symbiont]QKQ27555.1 hypothetical protein HUE57_15620 [Candidatus Reidiella endopervernicosa]